MKAEEHGRKTQNVLLVLFIAFIMITSVIGFIYSGSSTTVRDYGLKFEQNQGRWSAMINNREALFNFLPSEVADIEVSPEIISSMANTLEVDATYEGNSTLSGLIALAIYEMQQTFSFNFDKFLRSGLTSNYTENVPIITCRDATQAVPVLYFRESNATNLALENNCIIAEAKTASEIARIKDRLIYGMFGVMK